ncbi:MAG: LPS export ABC transporter periplasmic protein LptC [Bacteroidales bacterium]
MKIYIKNAITAIVVMAFFVACSEEFKKVAPKEFEGKFPEESADDIEIVFSDSGRTSFILYAPILNKYTGDNPYMDFPRGIKVISFDERGFKQSVLTADYAISEEQTMRMEASKNVIITDLQKNESIETEQIIWDKRNKKIYSIMEIKQIKSDGTINYGDGFEADERFTKYTVRNPRGEMIAEDL